MTAMGEPKDRYENDDIAYVASLDLPVYNILNVDLKKALERLDWW